MAAGLAFMYLTIGVSLFVLMKLSDDFGEIDGWIRSVVALALVAVLWPFLVGYQLVREARRKG